MLLLVRHGGHGAAATPVEPFTTKIDQPPAAAACSRPGFLIYSSFAKASGNIYHTSTG
jgi:hypothetical protein